MNNKSFYFYLIITIIFWSSFGTVSKLSIRRLDSFQLLFYVLLFATLGLFPILVFQKKLGLFKKYTLRDYQKMFLMGFVGIFLYHVLLFGSLFLIPANIIIILNYLWPIFAVILSQLILKEQMGFKGYLAIIMSFLGLCLMVYQGLSYEISSSDFLGYFMSIIAAFSWALFSVLGKKLKYETFTSMFIYLLSGLICTILIIPFVSSFILPNFSEVVGSFYLGFFTMSIAFVTWFKPLEMRKTSTASNFTYLVPFLSLLLIWLVLKEKILLTSIFGLILIIGGILIQKIEPKNRNK